MAWQIRFFQIIMYSTLYSSIAVLILLIYRKIFGKKLSPFARMLLWYGIIMLIILTTTVFTKGNFLRSYYSPKIQIPPIEIAFERFVRLVRVDGRDTLQSTGDIRMRIVDYMNIKSYSFNGKIVIYIVFFTWLFGVLTNVLRYGMGYLRLKSKLKDYKICNEESILNIIKKEVLSLGSVTPDVKLVPQKYFSEISTPCVIGFKIPTLLLINEQWEQLDDDEKHAVLMHEMMHIYYCDNYFNLLLVILHTIQWFNPLIYVGFKLLRQDLECLRDKQVLKRLSKENRYSYAMAILKIAKMNSKKYLNTLHSGMLLSSGIGFRMELLVDKKHGVIISEIIAVLFLIIVIAVMLFSEATIGFISDINVIV